MKIIFTIIFFMMLSMVVAQPKPEKAPIDPDYKISQEEFEEMRQNGIILPPIRPDFDPWRNFQHDVTRDFPTVYDMRNTSWLTPVKGQSSGGCWAYSTMGAVESRMLMLGLGEYDLSDNNLKYCHKYIPSRSTNGNHWMSSAYFARRSGPYLESEDPHPGGTTGTDDCPNDLSALYYIPDSRYPPMMDMDAVKQTVLDYGPVWSLLYYNPTYFNTDDNTYYYSGSHAVNHAGCVIGWNDTLVTAGGIGAWIVRNTYGQNWGEGGNYYLSYNDSQFLKYNGYWPNIMENEANTTIHQYDEIGGYWGVGFNSEIGYGMVKFEGGDRDCEITSIGSFIVSTGCGVEIKIYDNFNDSLYNLLGSKNETILGLPGYYTIQLDSAIQIPAGDDFYIQVKYNSNSPDDVWPIAIEDTISGYALPEIETGKYWIAPDPTTWPTAWYQTGHNTYYHYDLCIKAYTHQLYQVSGSVLYDNEILSPIAGIQLYLKDNGDAIIDSTLSDATGNYIFSGLRGGEYTIEACSGPTLGGINATDALAVSLHVNQQQGFILEGLPYQAADVNADDTINENDALLIDQKTVGILDDFPAGNIVCDSPGFSINGNDAEVNIKILSVGDVNQSFVPE